MSDTLTLCAADAVRVKRKQMGVSAGGLGVKAGVSRSYVSKFEQKQIIEPSLRAFCKLATALQMTPLEIFLVVHAESDR